MEEYINNEYRPSVRLNDLFSSVLSFLLCACEEERVVRVVRSSSSAVAAAKVRAKARGGAWRQACARRCERDLIDRWMRQRWHWHITHTTLTLTHIRHETWHDETRRLCRDHGIQGHIHIQYRLHARLHGQPCRQPVPNAVKKKVRRFVVSPCFHYTSYRLSHLRRMRESGSRQKHAGRQAAKLKQNNNRDDGESQMISF